MEKVLIRNYVLFTIVFLLIIAGMGAFAYPQVDDYEYALKAMEKGFWNSYIHEYFSWNGRYIATAVLSFNPLTWGWFRAYHIIPAMILLLHFFGIRLSFKIFFPEFTKKMILQLTMVAMGLYWMRHFALSQDLYWMSGAITHSVPIVLTLISYALLYRAYYQKFSWRDYFFIHGLTFLIIGFNETIMLSYSFSLFCIFLYYYFQTKKVSKSLVALLILGAIYSLIVILSPGNTVRAGGFEKSHRIFYSISNTITYTIIYSMKFLSPSYLVLLFMFRKKIKKTISKFSIAKINTFNFRFVMFTVLGSLFISILPSLWGMGRRPQDRTLSMVMFTYQLIFPFFAWHLYNRFYSKLNWMVKSFEKIPKRALPFIFVISLFCYNVYDLAVDSYKLPHYAKIMHDRYDKVKKLQDGVLEKATIYITKPEEQPYYLVFKDLFGGYQGIFEKYHHVSGKVQFEGGQK